MSISVEDINYLKSVIIDNNSFAIITHNNPDADAIGSSIFLEQLLINLNKTVDYIIQSKISPEFEPIVRKKRINKIFIPKYKKYDVVFILDACDCDRIYYRKNFANKTIIIDHHNNRPNIKYDKFINNNDISTGVTLYKIFNNFIEITSFMATCLYLTIIGDSDSFRIKNINSEVYDISSKLIQKGANTELINDIYNNMNINYIKLLGNVIKNINININDKIAYLVLTDEQISKNNCTIRDANKIIDFIKNIAGIEITLLLIDNYGTITIRARSKTKNISTLLKNFGGSGHKNSVGCLVTNRDIYDVLDEIIITIKNDNY